MNQTQSGLVSKKSICRACHGTSLLQWFSLGNQPLANSLMAITDIEKTEEFFPLDLVICASCKLVQLSEVVNPDKLFGGYLYYSSTSKVFRDHFKKMAEDFFDKGLFSPGDYVIDIGSNDGILLAPFSARGAKVIGIEPIEKIAEYANDHGIFTIAKWLNPQTVNEVLETTQGRKAAIITATNVFAHIDDSDAVLRNVGEMLHHDGLFVTEFPYFWTMIKDNTFDLIYHEHLSYFAIRPLQVLANRNGWSIVDVEKVPVHGGSIRVYWKKGVNLPGSLRMGDMIQEEIRLEHSSAMDDFVHNVLLIKDNIRLVIGKIKQNKGKIVGYGAPAKMSTMTNFFNLDSRSIDYIVDDSKIKQGYLSPGKHIRIIDPKMLWIDKGVTHVVIFAWNFAESIMKICQEKGYKGKFIIPFPDVEVVK